MTFEVFSQRDGRWAAEHYGLPAAAKTSTIGDFGCGITCIAQKLTLLGWPTTPLEVQARLLHFRAFKPMDTFNYIDWPKVPLAYPQFQYNGRTDTPNAPAPVRVMSLITDRLVMDNPVIIYVDASPYVKGLQQHFVLVTSTLESGALIIHNPWNGKVQDLRPYGRSDAIAVCGVILLDPNVSTSQAA